MTALDIYKKADLTSILAPAAIGAGIGGLGMGASSYFNSPEDKKDKGKAALKDALKGALLGGTAGAAYGGGKELLKELFPTSEIDNLVEKNPNLSPRDFSQEHPVLSAVPAVNNTVGPGGSAVLGAAAGMGKHLSDNVRGRNIYERALEAAKTTANERAGLLDDPKDRIKERWEQLPTWKQLAGVGDEVHGANVSGAADSKAGIIKQISKILSSRDMSPAVKARILTEAGRDFHSNPSSINMLDAFRKIDPLGSGASGPIRRFIDNALGRVGLGGNPSARAESMLEHPTATWLGRYGLSGVKGGLVGLGVNQGLEYLTRGLVNAVVPPDQLKIYNERAK